MQTTDTSNIFAIVDSLAPNYLKQNIITKPVQTKSFDVKEALQSMVIDQLFADGYLIENPIGSRNYNLTAKGRVFIENGGYKNYFKELQDEKDLKDRQIQSTIEANESVVSTNRFSTRILKINVGLLVATILSAIRTMAAVFVPIFIDS